MSKKITSRIVDNAAVGFLLTAALPMFAPVSKAFAGFFNTSSQFLNFEENT